MQFRVSCLILVSIAFTNAQAPCFSVSSVGVIENGVSAMLTMGDNLYVGGYFSSVGGVPNTAKIAGWNGNNWFALGSGLNNSEIGSIEAMTSFQGNLYIGGSFESAGGVQNTSLVAGWNGTHWFALGTGITPQLYVYVNSLAVFQNNLYIGGSFTKAGGISAFQLVGWNGTAYFPIINKINGSNFFVNAMTTYQGDLYMGTNGYYCNIERWDGYPIPYDYFPYVNATGNSTSGSAIIKTMIVDSGILYVGGLFDHIDGVAVNNVAGWNGTNWFALGNGITATKVNALKASGGKIYAVCDWDISLYDNSSVVFQVWDGSTWQGAGYGTYGSVYSIESYGGSLYVGGVFTTFKSNPIKSLVKLGSCGPTPPTPQTPYPGFITNTNNSNQLFAISSLLLIFSLFFVMIMM